MRRKLPLVILISLASTCWATEAPEVSSPQAASSPQPAPYTVPWQLRPVLAVNVARIDSAIAHYFDRNGNTGGIAAATLLTGAYQVVPNLALLIRLGFVTNFPPAGNLTGGTFLNPLFGAIYSLPFAKHFRAAFFLGVTAPLASGGGNYPSPSAQYANAAGVLARSAMDNALFSANYSTIIPGVGLAYVARGFTFQVEATLLQLIRMQGERVDADPFRTNFTTGLLAGYTFLPWLSFLGELRYQRWLDNETVFRAPSPAVENLSFAIGPRFMFRIGPLTARPGLAYGQGLLGPIARSGYTSLTHSDRILFLDFPVFF